MILTDRSRYQLQLGRCPRARWYQYHSQNGYGIELKQTAVPLATGIYVHEALAEISIYAKSSGFPDRMFIRQAIRNAIGKYRLAVGESGFQDESSDGLEYLINEQSSLIEALIWGFCKSILPELLNQYEIEDVELEDGIVLGCSCSVDMDSNSPYSLLSLDHAKDCKGVALVLRIDILLRRKSDRSLVIVDFKTAADIDSKYWIEQWEDNVQLGLYGRISSLRHKEPVMEAMIIGLNKGARKATKLDGDVGWKYSGPKRQSSILIYGWKREGNPPFQTEDWQFRYEFKDDQGKNRTLKGKGYQWSPVWEGKFEFQPEDWTPVEYWIESLDESLIQENFKFAGPFRTPDFLIDNLLESIEYNEREIVEKKLVNSDKSGYCLNYTFPQSWECKRYNANCQFLRLCKLEPGHDEPLKIGYKLRVPHHELELKEAIEKGALPADAKQVGENEEI